MPDTMPVIKTLVIGLGTTGGEICDYVAQRIRWEFGSIQKAPWIRFLYIATDQNEETEHPAELRKDFYLLSISSQEYENLLNNIHILDNISLSKWADVDLLRQLPGRAVDAGAGNIRMVGRLALLYPKNYNEVVNRVQQRLNDLRNLTQVEATKQRGPLPDGSNPIINFGTGNPVRVIVVGSLCGGTCSGTASDFGFLLRRVCSDGDKTQAFFTIPFPEFAQNKLKKNAYQALVELNTYHILQKFYGIPGSTRDYPYDAIYVCEPRDALEQSLEELHQAIADRVFLNSLVPHVDPFGKLIDAGIITRDDRAHVFCCFGLASMEYPAQRVIESCSKRLLAYALNEWNLRPIEPQVLEKRLEEIGLTWNQLRSYLLSSASGDSLELQMRGLVNEIIKLLPRNSEDAKEKLEIFRKAFTGIYSYEQSNQKYPPGFARRHFMERRESTANHVVDRLRSYVQSRLHLYQEGPNRLISLLREAEQRINSLYAAESSGVGNIAQQVNDEIDKVERYGKSLKLLLFWLRGPAIARSKQHLGYVLEKEMQARFDEETSRALRDIAGTEGYNDPGVLSRLRQKLLPIYSRAEELRRRVGKLADQMREVSERLANERPVVSGICLFEEEETVNKAFEEMLLRRAPAGGSVQNSKDKEAETIIRVWGKQLPSSGELPSDAVIPQVVSHKTWLDVPVESPDEHGIPDELVEELLRQATDPFLGLTRRDVLEQWAVIPDQARRDAQARDLLQKAETFGFVDENEAIKDIRAMKEEIAKRVLVLLPNSRYTERFRESVLSQLPHYTGFQQLSQSYRVIVLKEWYRWGLHGMPDITNGLANAQSGDFRVWYTRKDVAWVGVTDAEIARLHRARDVVAVAVLLDILQPEQESLTFKSYKLPLSVEAAACSLATGTSSVDGSSIAELDNLLSAHIQHRREILGSDEEFLKRLIDAAKYPKPGFTEWDSNWFEQRIESYCLRDTTLRIAFNKVFPPDEALMRSLWKEAGQTVGQPPRPCLVSGYYCTTCGVLIGRTPEEASEMGWTCKVSSDHKHVVRLKKMR